MILSTAEDANDIRTGAEIVGWGWYYLSTVLDDFSRFIVARKLSATMRADDVTATLELALAASGLDHVTVGHRPCLLSDNGASYILAELAEWLDGKGMPHVRDASYHPQTQGKIERWHQTLKNRILLEKNYYVPGDLERQVAAIVEHKNHGRYHESLGKDQAPDQPPLAAPRAGCITSNRNDPDPPLTRQPSQIIRRRTRKVCHGDLSPPSREQTRARSARWTSMEIQILPAIADVLERTL